jgi:hypothetical protein
MDGSTEAYGTTVGLPYLITPAFAAQAIPAGSVPLQPLFPLLFARVATEE